MLKCCENPKIQIVPGGYFRCTECGYDSFQENMWQEYSETEGFLCGSYHHNENIWSAGATCTDIRENIYRCTECGRMRTRENADYDGVCVCGTRYELLKEKSSFSTIHGYNEALKEIEAANIAAAESAHECEKYIDVWKYIDTRYDYDEKQYNMHCTMKYCKWCGKTISIEKK